VGASWTAKFTKGSCVHETNHWPAFWMRLPPWRTLKVRRTETKNTWAFAHDLQRALKLTVGFANIYCEQQQLCNWYIKNNIELSVSPFYLFITFQNSFVFVDSNSSISMNLHNYIHVHIDIFSHNDYLLIQWQYSPVRTFCSLIFSNSVMPFGVIISNCP
jgi:hypothetical protein